MLLTIHSWFRWFVLLATVGVGIRCALASREKPWTKTDTILARIWISAVDTQIAIGLILYFSLHPTALFFRVLHPLAMLGAMSVAHIAWVRTRRAAPEARFRVLGRGVLVTLAIVVLSIPWPR